MEVHITVSLVLPEYHQALAVDVHGQQYAITAYTQGLDWSVLKPGDQLVCMISDPPVRVLSARMA